MKIIKFEARLWIIFIAFAVVVTLSTSIFGSLSNKIYTMPNHSMAPTIKKGEKVKADMKAYETEDPSVGDLAIFIPEENRDLRWIFRVAAIPGDVMSYSEGTLKRNGSIINAPAPLRERTFGSPKRMKEGADIIYPYELGETEYFFLSDDPAHMHDSRYWGVVEGEDILGRVTSHY